MKKFAITTFLTLGLLAPVLPASAQETLPACPERATVTTVTQGCELTGSEEVLNSPAVHYLTSAFYVLVDLLGDARYDLQTCEQANVKKNAKIKALKAEIRRLRNK